MLLHDDDSTKGVRRQPRPRSTGQVRPAAGDRSAYARKDGDRAQATKRAVFRSMYGGMEVYCFEPLLLLESWDEPGGRRVIVSFVMVPWH